MSDWWVRSGYFAFEQGKDGFPRPGQVVKYYRGLKNKENGKPWTQKDLARVLGISEQAVRDLENRDAGMDSYDRRRFLADLFAIPPALLGIVSLEEMLRQQEPQQAPRQVSSPAKSSLVDTGEFQSALLSFWSQNHTHTAQGALIDILGRLDALYRALPYARSQKARLLELLCGYHQFVANVLRDQQSYNEAIDHLNKAYALAKKIDNKELIALVLHRRAITFQEQGRIPFALSDCEEACKFETMLPSPLLGAILLETGHVQAKAAQEERDRTTALSTIERGGHIIRSSLKDADPHFLKLNTDRYHLTRSSALIAMGWNREAIDELTQVNISPAQKRRQAYSDILQAQAYANRGMFPVAASMAQDALETVKAINSGVNIARIAAISQQLKQSSYGSNPEVAKLAYMLRQH